MVDESGRSFVPELDRHTPVCGVRSILDDHSILSVEVGSSHQAESLHEIILIDSVNHLVIDVGMLGCAIFGFLDGLAEG